MQKSATAAVFKNYDQPKTQLFSLKTPYMEKAESPSWSRKRRTYGFTRRSMPKAAKTKSINTWAKTMRSSSSKAK